MKIDVTLVLTIAYDNWPKILGIGERTLYLKIKEYNI